MNPLGNESGGFTLYSLTGLDILGDTNAIININAISKFNI